MTAQVTVTKYGELVLAIYALRDKAEAGMKQPSGAQSAYAIGMYDAADALIELHRKLDAS